MSIKTDVIIVGGGMVGGSLACALAQAGFSVQLIEKQFAPEAIGETYDNRVSALSRASQYLLQHIGAWQKIIKIRAFPYQKMHVEDQQDSGHIEFDAAEIGQPDLGHIVENTVIVKALSEIIAEQAHIQVHYNQPIQSIQLSPSSLTFEDGTTIEAELIIGADGGNSMIRELAEIKTQGWQYDQHAVVATIETEQSNQATAWQRFMPTGPLALLPLDAQHCSIVWSTSASHAKQLINLTKEEFCETLENACDQQWGKILNVGELGCYPLELKHAKTYVKAGLALVGDAAHKVHPLAGQGVNLGFLDVACLTETLISMRQKEQSLGRYRDLRHYERCRKSENTLMLYSMDFLKRLFSNDFYPLKLSRNLGLNIVNHAPPIKNYFIQEAMGLNQSTPLTRPVF